MRQVLARIEKFLWPSAEPTDRWSRLALHGGRCLFALIRDLSSGELSLRAMSLVYSTMLAVVPVLGFVVAVGSGLGLHLEIEPILDNALQPIGDRADEITSNIINFIENINEGLLGVISFGLLLFTSISMVHKVEGSFNYVWRVDRPRSFARRLGEYLGVILIGLPLIASALVLMATLSSITVVEYLSGLEPFGTWITWAGELLPWFMTVVVFCCLYVFVPNTRISLKPAMIGGLIGGSIWVASGQLFTALVASSNRLQSIYSGFAIVLILMFWLYISWLILLFGSQLAYYLQHPSDLRFGQRRDPLGNSARERLSLAVMYLIARDFAQPEHGWSEEGLASTLRVSRTDLEPVIAALQDRQLIDCSRDERLIPGRDPHRISLLEILDAVRSRELSEQQQPQEWAQAADAITGQIEASISREMGSRTIGDIVDQRLPTDNS